MARKKQAGFAALPEVFQPGRQIRWSGAERGVKENVGAVNTWHSRKKNRIGITSLGFLMGVLSHEKFPTLRTASETAGCFPASRYCGHLHPEKPCSKQCAGKDTGNSANNRIGPR